MPKMDETELASVVDDWISQSEDFSQSELNAPREWAIRFLDGEVDISAEEGRSKAVSHDVADAVEWLMPSLLRVFTSSERTVIYEPKLEEDEQAAKQATELVNYIFKNECEGYRILHHIFHDGLLFGNGIIKKWWEGSPEYKTETIRGLTEEELLVLASQPDVEEILELTENAPKEEENAAAY